MVSPRLLQERIASMSERLSDAGEAGLWVVGVVTAALLASLATDRVWAALAAGGVGMVLAALRFVKVTVRLRSALNAAEQDRAAMQDTLRRSQKMEALGRLTVGVAHDFNNHLTVISSNVEMLARRLGTDQARLSRHADAAMQGVRRAANLTGRLLLFSRQPAIEPEALDVNRAVDGLAELLRRTLGERITLEVRLSDVSWLAWADINQTENALLSLVVNARDQVPPGGVLSIAVSNVTLDPMFATAHPSVRPGDYIQVAVTGAPGEKTQDAPCGDQMTGVDLLMVRAFVREAGGCLLRSEPASGGVSLRLFLPRHVPPRQGLPRASAPSRSASGRKTILVVEDEAALRSVCVETLRELAYEVLEAPDAMEAFRLIADHGGIDLLFTDLGLPGGVSGRALADAARNVDPGIRVLFTTGYERPDIPDRSAALLRKPFNPAQLAAKVRDVLASEQQAERSETVRY
jgi:CheY-like chemotaxis protein